MVVHVGQEAGEVIASEMQEEAAERKCGASFEEMQGHEAGKMATGGL